MSTSQWYDANRSLGRRHHCFADDRAGDARSLGCPCLGWWWVHWLAVASLFSQTGSSMSGAIERSHHRVFGVSVKLSTATWVLTMKMICYHSGKAVCKENNVKFKTNPFIIYASIVQGRCQQWAYAVWVVLSISDLVRTLPDSLQQLSHWSLWSQVL